MVPAFLRRNICSCCSAFVRGRHKYPTGSGLGLSIVRAALEQADAKLELSSPESGCGLRAEIIMKSGRIRRSEPVGAMISLGVDASSRKRLFSVLFDSGASLEQENAYRRWPVSF